MAIKRQDLRAAAPEPQAITSADPSVPDDAGLKDVPASVSAPTAAPVAAPVAGAASSVRRRLIGDGALPVPDAVPALDVVDLQKIYPPSRAGDGPHVALDGVSLAIPRGSMFGLLGPNGAGKSTLINILAGLTQKTEGTARVWGYDVDKAPRAARSAIGVVPQELNLDSFFSAREMLEFQAGLYGVPTAARITDELLDVFDLMPVADMSTRGLSGGMRRRLMVAKAMVHRPPVLVLDEPTAGVDVELRQSLWSYVRTLNARGTTILLTTHYLEEAEALCDTIAILNQGRLVAHDNKENLLRRLDRKQVVITVDRDLDDVPANLKSLGWQKTGARQLTLSYRPSQSSIGRILLAVQVNGLVITDLSTEEADLNDVFMLLTHQDPSQSTEKQ